MKKLFLLVLVIVKGFVVARGQWVECNYGLYGGRVFDIIQFDKTTLLAGTSFGGIFISVDNGGYWTKIRSILSDSCITSLLLDGTNLLAGTCYGSLFISSDNGINWDRQDSGIKCTAINKIIKLNSNIFALTDNGIYMNKNNDNFWIKKDTCNTSTSFTSLISYNSFILAITSYGVYKSSDFGNNWIKINSGLLDKLSLISIETDGNNIFTGTNCGLYFTTDGGNQWFLKSSILNEQIIRSILINGYLLFAGTWNSVYASIDNGNTWTKKISGFPVGQMNPNILSLTLLGNYIFAYTQNFGLYRAELYDTYFTDIPEPKPSTSNFRIFPNPASDFIEINGIGNREPGIGSNIQIYNNLGECVISNPQTPNPEPLKIDVSALVSGVYYLKIGNEVKMFVK